MTRTVTLVLVDPTGRPLGALPEYEVESPWWQEVDPVVRGAPVEVSVLRLLDGHGDRPGVGGTVRYLAEVAEPPAVPLRPAAVDLAPHPLRAPYAEPGGPAASITWARAVLDRLGRPAGEVTQRRTWNLSAIWRLDSPHATAWLKQVPGFFRHEAAVLRRLGSLTPGRVPVLLADDGDGRMLLDHVPGEDRYGADPAERAAIAADQHDLQVRALPLVDDLVADGVPDLRGPALARWIRATIPPSALPSTNPLDGLAERLAQVAECGVPDTLVHGDLHPGNVRGDGVRRVVIDWGDAFVGHPAFDILRLTEGLPASTAAPLLGAWCARWRDSVPGCDPERAVALLRPVAALRMAAVYAMFLAGIEPSERIYHADDVPRCLAEATSAVG
ncbi:phosphotransferase family protein [Micromonospora coxensis]|uniref:Phosphotransferase enzyme family protein n=1 Tax=Micromonospora coxensis TaxID=356852 RepID=A0A1C5JAY0_9ACTN|nr:aminoglycoside phosphotransferase family protein [Micromonospora coxensis]SCG67725.1 Phosphotransferase enzyme family protein [Micromonospora coxensis]